MEKTLNKFSTIILYSLILLVPNIFAFSFPNSFVVPKLGLLIIGSLLIVFIKGLLLFKKNNINYRFGTIESLIVLLFFAYVLSFILGKVSFSSAFVFPGTASSILFSIIIFFIIKNLKNKQKKQIPLFIIASAIISSILTILIYFRFVERLLPLNINPRSFSTTGSIVQASVLSTISLFFLFSLKAIKTKPKKLLLLTSKIIIILGLVINLGKIVPMGKPAYLKLQGLPATISWKIALKTVREKPLSGVGPGNYIVAFNKYKPIEFNSTDLWERRFHNANSFYLTLLTETGLVGGIIMFFIILEILKILRRHLRETKHRQKIGWGFSFNPTYFSLFFLLLFFAFFPSDILPIFLLFVLLGLVEKEPKEKMQEIKIPNLFLGGFLSIISVILIYYSSTFIKAEYNFNQAINSFMENKGTESYNIVRKSISLNPKDDRYRVFYSNVNILLAQSFIQNQENEEISESSRETVSRFVSQAIREAKVSVNLNPERSANWVFLGDVYRSISSLAQNAIDFSIQSYSEGVLLDPLNPELRVRLGGLYYISGNFESAIETFKLAILVKPDYANAHFNLARSYKENGDLENSIKEYETTLLLLNPDSDDYKLIKEELETTKKGLETKDLKSENLEAPEELEQLIDPLLKDVEPPVTPTEELRKD